MSVAFRRESDEEHLEPKFELPVPPGPNYVTARGLAQVQARVAELEEALAAMTNADENQVASAKRVLRYWRKRQSTAQLVPIGDGRTISFGCTVDFTWDGRPRTITIVGDDEAKPAAGLLSFSAPLCRAMIDAEAAERIDFGGNPEAIEIVAIRFEGALPAG